MSHSYKLEIVACESLSFARKTCSCKHGADVSSEYAVCIMLMDRLTRDTDTQNN